MSYDCLDPQLITQDDMNFIAIAKRVEKQIPYADALEVARMCTLMCGAVGDRSTLADEKKFLEIWDEVNLRLQAATDQHVAVSEELETLTSSDPHDFSSEQIWVLVRSIKVQNQLLRLYVGDPTLEMG